MNKVPSILILLAGSALTGGAAGQEGGRTRVACTLPVIKAIADEIGGDAFETFSLSKADQDVHHVSPTPVMMNRVRNADVFLQIGLSLEIWSPEVTNGSGNAKIFPGAKYHRSVSAGITPEEIPAVVSRADGDVHPEGNSHIWLDPLRAKRIAENIAATFKELQPARAKDIDERLAKFQSRIDESLFGAELVKLVGGKKLTRLTQDGELGQFLESNESDGVKLPAKLGGWMKRAEPLRGVRVIEFHRTWIYLAKLFGFEIVGAIEEKPGIEPPPKHIVKLIDLVREQQVRLIVVDNFYDFSKPRRVAEESGAKVVIVPSQPTGEPGTDTYFAFLDFVVDRLLEGLKK